jgi:hypothetical protein
MMASRLHLEHKSRPTDDAEQVVLTRISRFFYCAGKTAL